MRNWRPMTWIIVAINVLMLVWVISAISTGADSTGSADCVKEARQNQFLNQKDCEAASEVGAAIGVGLLIVLWVALDFILGIIWLITGRGGRECPACGSRVKRGLTVCKKCGHDFRTSPAPPAPA